MKKLIVAASLLLLVGAGVAYTAASPSAKLAKQDRVYGGGQFSCDICPQPLRNLAVDAHAESDGSAAAGNSTYGTPGTATESYRSVTCESVAGNEAAIGGMILSGANAGAAYVQYFVDRGGPGGNVRDLASLSLIGPLDDPSWPAGFPDVCPPAGGSATLPPTYFELGAGDVVVQDSTTG